MHPAPLLLMSTLKQIEANRLNAQHSTGPRTPEGKAVTRMNAFQSGLDADSQFVVGEDSFQFTALRDEYFERFQPGSPEERFWLDTMIRNEWLLRRLFRAEAHLWEYHSLRSDRSEGCPLGAALAKGTDQFTRLQRRLTLLERSYKDAFQELRNLQASRHAVPAPAAPQPAAAEPPEPLPPPEQPQQNKDQTQKLGSFLTAVPQPSSVPPVLAPPPVSTSPSTAPKSAPRPPTRRPA